MFIKIFSPKKTINFLSYTKFAFTLSIFLIAMSVFLWINKGDSKYGIDYKGGSEIIVGFKDKVSSQDIRDAISVAGISDVTVQAFEESENNEITIRIPNDVQINNQDGKKVDVKSIVENALNTNLKLEKDNSFEIVKVDYVGPTAGEELRNQSLLAISLAVIGILIYISVRFEFAFALGAVIAVFHDVIVGIGIYLLCGQTISVVTLAAALTILGYSVNDTIVIFDRIRERLATAKNYVLEDIINESITETFSRTIITSITTLFSAISLLVLGGGEIRDLSLFLVIGLIAGTFSTIYIASPIALWWSDMQAKKEAKKAGARA